MRQGNWTYKHLTNNQSFLELCHLGTLHLFCLVLHPKVLVKTRSSANSKADPGMSRILPNSHFHSSFVRPSHWDPLEESYSTHRVHVEFCSVLNVCFCLGGSRRGGSLSLVTPRSCEEDLVAPWGLTVDMRSKRLTSEMTSNLITRNGCTQMAWCWMHSLDYNYVWTYSGFKLYLNRLETSLLNQAAFNSMWKWQPGKVPSLEVFPSCLWLFVNRQACWNNACSIFRLIQNVYEWPL